MRCIVEGLQGTETTLRRCRMMRLGCFLLAHAAVAAAAARGDGSTAISEMRRGRALTLVSAGRSVPDRSPAPALALPSSSWWHCKLIPRNPHAARRQMLTLRGGSVRSEERRAKEEHQRVRNVLLYYPNLIGTIKLLWRTRATASHLSAYVQSHTMVRRFVWLMYLVLESFHLLWGSFVCMYVCKVGKTSM